MDAVAIVAVITSLGSLLVIFGKTIKESTCFGCLKCETRTPNPSVILTPPPSPQPKKKEINVTEFEV